MKKTKFLYQLEQICKRLSIVVKYDRFFGRGGYCRLKNQAYFIINKRLSNEAKEQIFLNEFKSLETKGLILPPSIKKQLFDQK